MYNEFRELCCVSNDAVVGRFSPELARPIESNSSFLIAFDTLTEYHLFDLVSLASRYSLIVLRLIIRYTLDDSATTRLLFLA